MNSITRCPSCATHYQVASADMQAAKGWLRCGQCGHVFDSTGLVLRWTPPVAVCTEPEGVRGNMAAVDLVADPADRIALDDLLQKEDRIDLTQASAELASFEQALSSFKPGHGGLTAGPMEDKKPPLVESVWVTRYAVWSLALILVLQLLFVQRHAIAAYWPDSGPAIRHVCHSFGCQVSPMRDVEGLVIESSELVQRGDVHALRWTVRNTTPTVLGMSTMELALMDGAGKVVLRRVFSPMDMGAPEVLVNGQSWSGELNVWMDAEWPFSDYRLSSFYP